MLISLFNESFDLFDKVKAAVKAIRACAENKLSSSSMARASAGPMLFGYQRIRLPAVLHA